MGNKLLVFRCYRDKIWAIKFMEGNLPDEDKMKEMAITLKSTIAKKGTSAPEDQCIVRLIPGDHCLVLSEQILVPQLQPQGMSWDNFKELVSSSDEALVRVLLGIGCATAHIGEPIPLE